MPFIEGFRVQKQPFHLYSTHNFSPLYATVLSAYGHCIHFLWEYRVITQSAGAREAARSRSEYRVQGYFGVTGILSPKAEGKFKRKGYNGCSTET